jgi:hypothetical protein
LNEKTYLWFITFRSMDRGHIRELLIEDLRRRKVFWSFHAPDPDRLSDDWLIENVLIHADLESIYRLFEIFPERKIKRIWKDRLLPDVRQHSMNLLYAYLLFHIKDPDRYLHAREG